MKLKYYVIDLFAGCGGSAWGFQNAGFTIKAAVEINKTAADSFKLNFPEAAVINRDIREITGKSLMQSSGLTAKDRDNTVILACPPCQGFSSARRNNQRISDPRNELILEFVRLVKEIKPIAFVMENVPGLASGIGKSVFLEAVNQLKDTGYNITEPKVLEAIDYGVPQKRKRLVLMGTRIKDLILVLPSPTHGNPDKLPSGLKPWKTVRDAIGELPVIEAGKKDYKDKLHVSATLSDTNIKRIKNTPHDGGDRRSWPNELILECHRNSKGHTDVYGRMHWGTPSPTITGGCMMLSKGRFGHPEQDRAISLREAARLQTFPDAFIFSGNMGDMAKQIGNAVPSLLAKAIADSLYRSLESQSASAVKKSNPILLKVGFFSNSAYSR